MWKICHNILPTKKILFKKKVIENNLCPRCHNLEESNLHAIFFCPLIQHVWFASPLGFKPLLWNSDTFTIENMFNTLMSLSTKENLDFNLALLTTIAYFLWLDRNNQVFQHSKPLTANSILTQALASITREPLLPNPQYSEKICIPKCLSDCSLILVDGGFDEGNYGKKASYGFFAFENCSSPYFMGAGIADGESAEESELWAIKQGIIQARSLGTKRIFVCSDCRNAITAVNREISDLTWTLKHLVEDIRKLAEDFDFCYFKQVPRKAVAAAHKLAKVVSNSNVDVLFWNLGSNCIGNALCNPSSLVFDVDKFIADAAVNFRNCFELM